MQDGPFVSIITPTYNHETYIADCIDSVKKQTYTNWEMIILNDGSTDGTGEVIRRIAGDEPRIRYIEQDNVGIFRLGETYNKGLEISSGKYIAILEGDDVWEPSKLERQVKAMEDDPGIVLAWGRAYTRNSDLKQILGEHPGMEPFKKIYYSNTPKGSILNLLYFHNHIPALTILIRRTALERIGGFLQGYGLPLVDFPTLLELSLEGTFYFDTEFLGSWRIYAMQVTKTYTIEMYLGLWEAVQKHYEKHHAGLGTVLDISYDEVKSGFDRLIQIAYARSGRYKLIRKDYTGARKEYIRALFYPRTYNLVWRLRAAVGLVMSFLGMDVEWIARLLGKKVYKVR